MAPLLVGLAVAGVENQLWMVADGNVIAATGHNNSDASTVGRAAAR